MTTSGISGLSIYVPRPRVSLRDWCQWYDAPWKKIEAVVGRSFRMCGPGENVYTMAAAAALRLIEAYDVDPRDVGYFGLGTESSTDNAAGAVIVKGMLDEALRKRGRPALSRNCEVPELKQACLGGVYGLKSALRYAAYDGADRLGIVISADIAEYARGSTGEQTQGAGAVAMLVEANPRMLAVDLRQAGSAADYRGFDFRKPFVRHFMPEYDGGSQRLHDFPVFNGKYSTLCYIDEVIHAVGHMCERSGIEWGHAFDEAIAVLLHRPYHYMPVQAMSHVLAWGLARSEAGRQQLRALADQADVDVDEAIEQMQRSPELFAAARDGGPNANPIAAAQALAKAYARTPQFDAFVAERMSLGSEGAKELGNLYTGSLPAWIASAMSQAAGEDAELAGRRVLAIGYGSGDAAEALPMQVVPGWRQAAQKIGFAAALDGAIDLDQSTYEALHDGRPLPSTVPEPEVFAVRDVGRRNAADWQDIGIEYYRAAE